MPCASSHSCAFFGVARRYAGEFEPRDAVGEPARQRAADGAEAGDGDARCWHQENLRVRCHSGLTGSGL